MEKESEATYFYVSSKLIINTLIVGAREYNDMEALARQTEGVSVFPVPPDEAVDAYIRAAQERKSAKVTLRHGTVEAAVAGAFSMGGSVVRIMVVSEDGQAERRLTTFDERVRSMRRRQRRGCL